MLGKNDILTFGKFKNKTIQWIFDNHPQYIVWLDENVKTISIDQYIVAQCIENCNDGCSEGDGYDWYQD